MRIETAMMSATIAGCALLFAIYVHLRSQKAQRRSMCFEVYRMWSSPLLAEARHRSWKKLERLKADASLAEELSRDDAFLYDYSMVEHFFVDLHALIRERMICPNLARTLFAETTRRWLDQVEATLYAKQARFSYHYGRSAAEAKRGFVQDFLPPASGLLARPDPGASRDRPKPDRQPLLLNPRRFRPGRPAGLRRK